MNGNEIQELHLSTLQEFIRVAEMPPTMAMANSLPVNQAPSDTIEWEVEYGSSTMIPAVARGARGPAIGMDGTAKSSAKAAYFTQTAFLGEEFLNNLRKAGTYQEKLAGQTKIAEQQQKLLYGMQRRREWMAAQMMFEGGFSMPIYANGKSVSFQTVDYGVPIQNKITLSDAKRWVGGADADTYGDLNDVKDRFEDFLGTSDGMIVYMNGKDMRALAQDSKVIDLLKVANISEAAIRNTPGRAVAEVLGVGEIREYNQKYTVEAMLTVPYSGGTSVTVDNAADFIVGGDLFIKTGNTRAYVRSKITAVNKDTNVITIAAELTGVTALAGQHHVVMQRYFLPEGQIACVIPSVDGRPIAKMLEAPHGLPATYGMRMRTKPSEYPDGVTLISEDMCLPVLYYPEAVQYIKNIKAV